MMRIILLSLTLLGAALACCRPEPEPPTPPVATGGTATGGAISGGTGGWEPLPTGGTATGGAAPADDCARAEGRLRELGCTRAADGGPRWETPAGAPFAEFCRAREADGDSLCPACIAAVAKCSDVDPCRAQSPNCTTGAGP